MTAHDTRPGEAEKDSGIVEVNHAYNQQSDDSDRPQRCSSRFELSEKIPSEATWSVDGWADHELAFVDLEITAGGFSHTVCFDAADARDVAALLIQAAERAEELVADRDAPSEE